MTTKKELLGMLCLINQIVYTSGTKAEERLAIVNSGKKMMDIALGSYSGHIDDEIMLEVGNIYVLISEVNR